MSNYTQGVLFDPKILSEQTLLDLYNTAVRLVLEGKTIMQFAGQGSEFTSKFPIDPMIVLSEARYALKQLNPSKYGNIVTNVQPIFI